MFDMVEMVVHGFIVITVIAVVVLVVIAFSLGAWLI